MIRAAVFVCVLAGPVAAQEMTAETCRIGWQAYNQLAEVAGHIAQAEPTVTEEGWCIIDQSNADLREDEFVSLRFRGVGIEEAVENNGAPRSLDVSVAGVDIYNGLNLGSNPALSETRTTLNFSYTYEPKGHVISITEMGLDTGELGHFMLSANGVGMDLSTLEAMQSTSGAGRLHAVSLQVQTTPLLSTALMAEWPRTGLNLAIRMLPEKSMEGDSRDALLRFFQAGPDAAGFLRVSARSELGLAASQVAGGMNALSRLDGTPESFATAMEILFSGVTIDAEWVSVE